MVSNGEQHVHDSQGFIYIFMIPKESLDLSLQVWQLQAAGRVSMSSIGLMLRRGGRRGCECFGLGTL
jgi:hypothetical protein